MSRYEDMLIERHVALPPGARGPADARVAGGVHVWALIGYLGAEAAGDGRLTDEAITAAGEDYALPRDAVKAAVAYYRLHRAAIDARLAQHAAFFKESAAAAKPTR
jgi:hypothetical protein